MDLLRFISAGSVDDGKSTLIGRLLYDTKNIFQDQLDSIRDYSKRKGDEYLNLALLTDGLRAEREQGITIDVAYRYFSSPKRKFIIADAPGHIQYTRNMVTAASNSDLAILLVDAQNGLLEQTRRHTFIVSLMGIRHIIVCINKMDMVDYSEERFEELKAEYEAFCSKLDLPYLHFIPVSALKGDNVVDRSENMPWFPGSPLLYTLENVHVGNQYNLVDSRFPVQYVIRPQSEEFPDYRAYAGRVEGGVFKPGDEVTLLPSGFNTKIKSIDFFGEDIKKAYPPMSVSIRLEDDLDLSRGDMIVKPHNRPKSDQDLEIMLCWLSQDSLVPGRKYLIKHNTRQVPAMVKEMRYKLDINTLHRAEDDPSLHMNDIGRVRVRSAKPLFHDAYKRNRQTGSIILIDPFSNQTVAAGMIL